MPDTPQLDSETRFKVGSRRTYFALIGLGAVALGIAAAGRFPYPPVVATAVVVGASAGLLLAMLILYVARGFFLGR
jgi:uncharacterized membrane protein YqgA involved in biofilm formation